MGQPKIATEQVIADLPDGRTVIIANPGEEIPPVPVLGYVEGGEVPEANIVDSQTLKGTKTAAGDDAKTEEVKVPGTVDELKEALVELEVDFDSKAKKADLEKAWRAAIAERDAEEKSLQTPPNDKSLGAGSVENK